MNTNVSTQNSGIQCRIDWIDDLHKVNSNIHKIHCNKVNLLNFLQSPLYASTITTMGKGYPRLANIFINGENKGFALFIISTTAGRLFEVISLERGPLWHDGVNVNSAFPAFLQTLKHHYPPRWNRKIRLIPELPDTEQINSALKHAGFQCTPRSTYQTSILDLTQPISALRQNLRKNWRHDLKKAETKEIVIECDVRGKYLDWIVQRSLHDQKIRKYKGISAKMIHAIHQSDKEPIAVFRALYKGRPIAAVLLLLHRPSATYQIGWTHIQGREIHATNLLLWKSVLYLKENGFKTFDLGGMNETTAHTIKYYKEGMGGQTLTLPGLYVARPGRAPIS